MVTAAQAIGIRRPGSGCSASLRLGDSTWRFAARQKRRPGARAPGLGGFRPEGQCWPAGVPRVPSPPFSSPALARPLAPPPRDSDSSQSAGGRGVRPGGRRLEPRRLQVPAHGEAARGRHRLGQPHAADVRRGALGRLQDERHRPRGGPLRDRGDDQPADGLLQPRLRLRHPERACDCHGAPPVVILSARAAVTARA